MEFVFFAPIARDMSLASQGLYDIPIGLDDYVQVAQQAEANQFDSLLLPFNYNSLDPLLLAAALLPQTKSIHLLLAQRFNTTPPAVWVKMWNTLAAIAPGRVDINVVNGGAPADLAMEGDSLSHDDRYARTREFTEILRQMMQTERVTYEGAHYKLKNALVWPPFATEQLPRLYLSGSSEAARELAADHYDTLLMVAKHPEETAVLVQQAKEAAANRGRSIRVGVNFYTIARETREEALAVAAHFQSLIERRDVLRYKVTDNFVDSVGTRSIVQLFKAQEWIDEVLWTGLCPAGLPLVAVGSYEEIAAEIERFQAAGVETFVMAGFPHVEEAAHLGHVISKVKGSRTCSLSTSI